MDNNIYIETLIWDYINGSVSDEEKKQVTDLFQQDENWRNKYAEMLQLHQFMQSSIILESPSVRFTKNVMEEIAIAEIAPSAKTYINRNIISIIALFFITCIAGLILYVFFKIDWGKNELEQPLSAINLNTKNYLKPQFLTIFLAVNSILCLIFFDKLLFRKHKKSTDSNTDFT